MAAICPTCGTELPLYTRFCPKDGTNLVAAAVRRRTTAPPTSPVDAATKRPPPTPTNAPHAARPHTARPERPLDPLIGATIDDRYRIVRQLGAGGVGAVYEGEHLETRRLVAIKVLHTIFATTQEFHIRFEREARAASRLSHPSCVSVIDFGRMTKIGPPPGQPQPAETRKREQMVGMPYLVMEFVRGQTLVDRLEHRQPAPLDLTESVLVARGVLSALRHAHSLGIVHRDIKPANIMLATGGATGVMVKLLDFGLAKDTGMSDSLEPLTLAGMVFGTPGYISPEQAREDPVDARSDLYSLGVVLFEMACGRRPFVHEDPIDAVRDHLQTAPPPPRTFQPAMSIELERVILRALEKRPEQRFASAAEFIEALEICPEVRAVARTPSWIGRVSGELPRVGEAARSGELAGLRSLDVPPRLAQLGLRERVREVARDLGAEAEALRRFLWPAVGVGVVLLIAIALLAKRRPPVEAARPAPPTAVELLGLGKLDEAIARAREQLRQDPADAESHRVLAVAYQRRLSCGPALEEAERAVSASPEMRGDPALVASAIACLSGRTQGRAVRLLCDRIGPAAVPALKNAVRSDPSAEVRRGARRALERMQ